MKPVRRDRSPDAVPLELSILGGPKAASMSAIVLSLTEPYAFCRGPFFETGRPGLGGGGRGGGFFFGVWTILGRMTVGRQGAISFFLSFLLLLLLSLRRGPCACGGVLCLGTGGGGAGRSGFVAIDTHKIGPDHLPSYVQ